MNAKIKDAIPGILAIFFTLGYFAVIAYALFVRDYDNSIVTSVTVAEALILGYYFKARYSKNKDKKKDG
jgi:hypothetical protein